MSDTEKNTLEEIGKEWLVARDIIADFLGEILSHMSRGHLEHNAAAIIARLANNKPPILLEFHKDA